MTEHNTITGTGLHEAFHYVSASDPGAVGAGLYWLDTAADPYVLKRRNAGNSAWVTIGASSGGWELLIDEPGTSFTNFTSGSGSWSSDGTVIKQTGTGYSSSKAQFNTKVPLGANIVIEADIQYRNSGGENRAGFLLGYPGPNGTHGAAVFMSDQDLLIASTESVGSVYWESYNFTVNTWYNLRVVHNGKYITVYIDDVLFATAGADIQGAAIATHIGLYTFFTEAWFKNIKVWAQALPA